MQLLDEALGEVDTIEGKLSSYEEMLQSVKEQMDQISQSNRLIQISNTNNGKLLDEIQFLVVTNSLNQSRGVRELSLSFSDGLWLTFSCRITWTCLRDTSELCRMGTSPPLKELRPASTPLKPFCSAWMLPSDQVNLHEALLSWSSVFCLRLNGKLCTFLCSGHEKLLSVKQQQQMFTDLRDTFARRLTNHLNNVFVHQVTHSPLLELLYQYFCWGLQKKEEYSQRHLKAAMRCGFNVVFPCKKNSSTNFSF